MQQISELNVDTTINELLNSELGFLLIKKDTKNEDVYEVLNKTGIVSDWTLRFVLTNNYHHIVFHFFLFYIVKLTIWRNHYRSL